MVLRGQNGNSEEEGEKEESSSGRSMFSTRRETNGSLYSHECTEITSSIANFLNAAEYSGGYLICNLVHRPKTSSALSRKPCRKKKEPPPIHARPEKQVSR